MAKKSLQAFFNSSRCNNISSINSNANTCKHHKSEQISQEKKWINSGIIIRKQICGKNFIKGMHEQQSHKPCKDLKSALTNEKYWFSKIDLWKITSMKKD